MMYTPRAQAAFQHQQFFFAEQEKLANLLNTISHDARAAMTFTTAQQQAYGGADYHELTTVTTQLLEEAQAMSAWTFDTIERNGVQLQPFSEKVVLVEQVAAELRSRVQETIAAAAATAAARPVAGSKKRSRGRDDEEEELPQQQRREVSFSYKRARGCGVDQEMSFEPSHCGPYAQNFLQPAWRMQPICE